MLEIFNASGPGYLEAFESTEEGRAFLKDYLPFAEANAHRGHSDRDPFFARRGDDPSIDFENFKTLLSANSSIDPGLRNREVSERRNSVIADIEACLKSRTFGSIRVMIFQRLLDYAYRFFFIRDEQRHYHDRYTYGVRRASLEIGRRLVERKMLNSADEAFFLGRHELLQTLQGHSDDPLLRQKVDARRRNFDLMQSKKANPPMYLKRGRPVSFENSDHPGGMKGVGTSRGFITARARVVTNLKDIGLLHSGEILVTESTDPGWTPVFNLIGGLVLETGGMLAHGSCLAREYGLPSVQLANATRLIPDGAMITVNGDTGEVTLTSDVGEDTE